MKMLSKNKSLDVMETTNLSKWFFVSRHSGAIAWSKQFSWSGKLIYMSHLELDMLRAGDVVIGSLPINLVFELCEKGVAYYHLSLKVQESQRGVELSADDLNKLGATIESYFVSKQGEGIPDFCYKLRGLMS